MQVPLLLFAYLVVPAATQTTNSVLSIILSDAGSIYSSITSAIGNTQSLTTVAASTTDGLSSSTETPNTTATTSSPTSASTKNVATPTASTDAVSSVTSTSASVTTPGIVTTTTPSSSSTVVPAAASGSTSSNDDRTTAIAVGSVLGALVLGLLILLGVILCARRRQREQRSREDSLLQPDDDGLSPVKRQRGSRLWFPPRRRDGHRTNTTGQPLMSEGSPRYGFAPSALRGEQRSFTPRVNQAEDFEQSEAPMDTENANQGPSTLDEGLQNTRSDDPLAGAATTYHQRSTETSQDGRFEHDIGNPYRHSIPVTPDLLRSAPGRHKRKGSYFPDDFPALRQDPLASHPTNAADLAAAGLLEAPGETQPRSHWSESGNQSSRHQSLLEVPAERDDQSSNGASSISREGFANAIAGLGFEAPDENAVKNPSKLSEADLAPRMTQSGQASPIELSEDQDTLSGSRPIRSEVSKASAAVDDKPSAPRLDIPSSLAAGVRNPKRARFSETGDVSPPTRSWLFDSGTDQMQSTLSPVSPDRTTVRGYSLSPRRVSFFSPDSYVDTAPKSAPLASTYPIPAPAPIQMSTPGSGLTAAARRTKAPPQSGRAQPYAYQRAPEVEPELERPSTSLPTDASGSTSQPRPGPTSTSDVPVPSIVGVKRKPLPLNLNRSTHTPATVPVPISKYAQPVPGRPQQVYTSLTRFPSIHGQRSGQRYGSERLSPEGSSSRLQLNPSSSDNGKGKGKGKERSTWTPTTATEANTTTATKTTMTGGKSQLSEKDKQKQRETLRWWEEDVNKDFAKMYGGYFAGPGTSGSADRQSVTFPLPPPSTQQPQPSQSSQTRPPVALQQQSIRQPSSQPYVRPPTPPPPDPRSRPLPRPLAQIVTQRQPQLPPGITGFGFGWRDSQRDSWRDSLSIKSAQASIATSSGEGSGSGSGHSNGRGTGTRSVSMHDYGYTQGYGRAY